MLLPPAIYSASQDDYVLNSAPVHRSCYPTRLWGVPGTPKTAFDFVRHLETIQISAPLSESDLAELQEASRHYPEKPLSVSGHDDFEGDLEWLRGFEHVQNLFIHVYEATSFEVLSGFINLRRLDLGRTRSAKPSLAFLANCPELEEAKLQGANRGLEAVASLDRLRLLRLLNLKVRSLDFLSPIGNTPINDRIKAGRRR